MSYTRINGMRSARYPLQGCGSCQGVGADDGEGPPKILGTAAVGAIGLGLFWYMAPKPALKPNRRHRRRRR